ncbi:MAG: VCBS repeat-containing protein [Gammaproteobacteria bacterium]|nr:VCBS repeat-containing protein [Gammaproteobacteria bacterium]
MRGYRNGLLLALVVLCGTDALQAADTAFCPEIYRKGVLEAPFNVAFLHVQKFNQPDGGTREGLLISSFFNVEKDPAGRRVIQFTQRDLVARIPNLDAIDYEDFDGRRDIEVITDLDGVPRQVWPNETSRVPDGVVPFEAVVSPQGFLSTPRAGRISLINLSDPERAEYIVHQSTLIPPRCQPGSTDNQPWFYHDARFIDMDGDGLRDLVTVRTSFLAGRGAFCPPSGQLVWFRNPGDALDRDTAWEEHMLVDVAPEPGGPEVNMNAHDFDGDGVPEIVASHFFKYDAITIYGAPAGKRWSDVDPVNGPFVRQKDIMRGQGDPFAVEIVDMNLDGRVDVLTSNHQGDQCFEVTKTEIPGRAIAIEQPADGRIFSSDWTVHVIKDNIRAAPTFPEPERGPGRLAPNRAVAFWPQRSMRGRTKPWVILGGDEAAKVWVLQPESESEDDWRYRSAVVFDINDYFGPNTTQTLQDDPQGVSISTIGGLAWRYDRPGPDGMAEFYLPVFEARQIQVLSFRPSANGRPLNCPEDSYVACP